MLTPRQRDQWNDLITASRKEKVEESTIMLDSGTFVAVADHLAACEVLLREMQQGVTWVSGGRILVGQARWSSWQARIAALLGDKP